MADASISSPRLCCLVPPLKPVYVCVLTQPDVKVTETDRAQEDTIRRAFTKVAGDDLEIDAYELKDILNAAYQRGQPAPPTVIAHVLKFDIQKIDFIFLKLSCTVQAYFTA